MIALSTLLTRLAQPAAWEQTETEVLGWQLEVYSLPPVQRVHLDTSTEFGFHVPQAGGVMQLGTVKTTPRFGAVEVDGGQLGERAVAELCGGARPSRG